MLGVTLFLLPATLSFLIWNSYRKNRVLTAAGEGYHVEGRVRWEDSPDADAE